MVTRVSTVNSATWFLAILLLALSFPIQVYANSPYPSLLPYALIGFAIFLNLQSPGRSTCVQTGRMDLMVGIYLFLLFVNTGWQAAFGVIGTAEALSAIAVFLLPVVCYWYFLKLACDQEIRAVLWALAVASLIVGTYFAYDSVLKLGFEQVSDYALKAFQYSLDRAAETAEELNDARIRPEFRSFGLLESHSISGAWVNIGAFAALALVPASRLVFRRVIVSTYGAMLLLGLNFTSIFSFILIIFLFEFDGVSILKLRISPRTVGKLASLWLVLVLLVAITTIVAGDAMVAYMMKSLSFQKDLLLGLSEVEDSFYKVVIRNIQGYLQHISNYPISLLLGDGFSISYGLRKGGDVGFVESMARFGLPYFLLIVFGFLGLIRVGLRQIKLISRSKNVPKFQQNSGIIQFAVRITALILITEGHYTVWTAKSVLPIVFFVMALHVRFRSNPQSVPVVKKPRTVATSSANWIASENRA